MSNGNIKIISLVMICYVSGDHALKCFVCSGVQEVTPDCVSILKKSFEKKCDDQMHKFRYPYISTDRYFGCRKVIQRFRDKTLVRRSCADKPFWSSEHQCTSYVRNNRGNELAQTFCDCTGDLCNGSPKHRSKSNMDIFVVVVIATASKFVV